MCRERTLWTSLGWMWTRRSVMAVIDINGSYQGLDHIHVRMKKAIRRWRRCSQMRYKEKHERHRHSRRRTDADRIVSGNAFVDGGAEARVDRYSLRAGKLGGECGPD